jgi:multidrug efflux pump subunit AcrA (membrane-fusion protein)
MVFRSAPVAVSARAGVAAVLLAALAAGCAKSAPPKRVSSTARVPVVSAQDGVVKPGSTLGGIIVPFQNVQISSTLVEPTVSVNVNEGDHVTKGEVLAQLDTGDLEAQLKSDLGTAASDRAKAAQTYDQASLTITQNGNTVNAAQATLRQAQATLNKDRLDLARYSALYKQGYVAQQQYQAEVTLVQSDEQAVRAAQVTVQNAKSQVAANGTTTSGLQGAGVEAAKADEQTALGAADQVRVQIAKATIVSPIDGVVVNRNLNPGEYPGTRQLFTLQETDKMYAVLNGSGAQIVGVATGSPAKITSTDHATLSAQGKVVGVLDEVTPGSTNFVVKIVVPNPEGLFHSGMVVSGRVARPQSRGITVPVTAFLDDTHTTVQVVSNGLVKTQNVVMVADDGKNAVVRGLAQGVQVVANGQLGLADGQTVKPEPLKPAKTIAER